MRGHPIAFAMSLLAGCYLVHERGTPTPSMDAGLRDASASDAVALVDVFALADVGCVAHTPASIRFEPPLMPARGIRVVLLGIVAEPAANGVRVHLDTCGGMPPCPLDLIVSNVDGALADIPIAPNASGMLSYDDALGAAAISVADGRRCAGCGGTLDIVAGAIVSGLGPDIMLGADTTLVCAEGCVDEYGAFATNGTVTLQTSAGVAADVPPLHARIASNMQSTCARCDCSLPAHDPTGIVWMATGSFSP